MIAEERDPFAEVEVHAALDEERPGEVAAGREGHRAPACARAGIYGLDQGQARCDDSEGRRTRGLGGLGKAR